MKPDGPQQADQIAPRTWPGMPLAVLDFRRHNKVPNYLGGKEQRRVLLVVGLAGVVAILFVQWADLGRRPTAALGPDRDPPTHARAADGQPSASSGREPGDRPRLPAPAEPGEWFPGVRADYLDHVEDDTVFRAAEADAWFHLLELLERTDPRDLSAWSMGRVGFLQLDQQAREYRGRVVTIAGTVRGAKPVPAPQNGFGIGQYHQLWLQPDRSSPALVAIYALHLPEGFPLGRALEARATATGFFFKRWAYQSQEGVVTAPLILARTVDWQPGAAAPAPEAAPGGQIAWPFLIVLSVGVLIWGYFAVRGQPAARWRHQAGGAEVAESLAARRSENHGQADAEGNDA